jgi:hypothetical protein
LLLVTAGTMEQIAEDFRQVGGLVGAWYVNVTDIIQRIRSRARELGIDIEEPFYFAPDDPRFSEIIRAVKSERDGRIERLRKDKKNSVPLRSATTALTSRRCHASRMSVIQSR